MTGKVFFWLGLAFLILFVASWLTLTSLSQSPKPLSKLIPLFQPYSVGGNGGPLPFTVSAAPPDALIVEGNTPIQMDMNTSDTIVIMLTELRPFIQEYDPPINAPLTPTPAPVNRKNIAASRDYFSPNIFADYQELCRVYNRNIDCTMDAIGIDQMFGSGYKVYADAYLVTSSFDVQPLAPAEQSADQTKVEWDWNIFSKSVGSQIINIGIDLHWKAMKGSGKEDIFRQLWISSCSIIVNSPPAFTVGQFTLSSTITGTGTILFGGLSIPWVIEQRQKRKEEKEKAQEESKPSKRENLTQAASPSHLKFLQEQRAMKLAQRRRTHH